LAGGTGGPGFFCSGEVAPEKIFPLHGFFFTFSTKRRDPGGKGVPQTAHHGGFGFGFVSWRGGGGPRGVRKRKRPKNFRRNGPRLFFPPQVMGAVVPKTPVFSRPDYTGEKQTGFFAGGGEKTTPGDHSQPTGARPQTRAGIFFFFFFSKKRTTPTCSRRGGGDPPLDRNRRSGGGNPAGGHGGGGAGGFRPGPNFFPPGGGGLDFLGACGDFPGGGPHLKKKHAGAGEGAGATGWPGLRARGGDRGHPGHRGHRVTGGIKQNRLGRGRAQGNLIKWVTALGRGKKTWFRHPAKRAARGFSLHL